MLPATVPDTVQPDASMHVNPQNARHRGGGGVHPLSDCIYFYESYGSGGVTFCTSREAQRSTSASLATTRSDWHGGCPTGFEQVSRM